MLSTSLVSLVDKPSSTNTKRYTSIVGTLYTTTQPQKAQEVMDHYVEEPMYMYNNYESLALFIASVCWLRQGKKKTEKKNGQLF